MTNVLLPISSTDISSSTGDLTREEQIVVIPSGGSQWQRLSASLVAACYLGVRSAVASPVRASVALFENSTSTTWSIPSYHTVLKALTSQPVEELQDGMTLRLGTALMRCMRDLGDVSFVDLAQIALKGDANPEALSHALRWIGRMADPETFQQRLLVLARALEAPSPVVRDGAALGLVELGSPAATPALDTAIGRESNEALRQDLEQAATYLRAKG